MIQKGRQTGGQANRPQAIPRTFALAGRHAATSRTAPRTSADRSQSSKSGSVSNGDDQTGDYFHVTVADKPGRARILTAFRDAGQLAASRFPQGAVQLTAPEDPALFVKVAAARMPLSGKSGFLIQGDVARRFAQGSEQTGGVSINVTWCRGSAAAPTIRRHGVG